MFVTNTQEILTAQHMEDLPGEHMKDTDSSTSLWNSDPLLWHSLKPTFYYPFIWGLWDKTPKNTSVKPCIALYWLNVLVGRELLCVSGELQSEVLADKDFSIKSLTQMPLEISEANPRLWEKHNRHIKAGVLLNARQSPGKERSDTYSRTNSKLYLSHATKLNTSGSIGYLLKFLLWFHV